VKLWIAKNSEIPIHDQLVAQITLGIASSDLKHGERLPSTRELARRFGIHQNTVSAAYRELSARGLIEAKKGSGVYVSGMYKNGNASSLDGLFARFVAEAARSGHTKAEINEYVTRTLLAKTVRRFVVVESDPKLREIIAYEVSSGTGVESCGITVDSLSNYVAVDGTQLVALANERHKIDPIVDKCCYLNANSVPSAMAGQDRPASNELIAVASGWEQFLSFAKLYLAAAKIDSRCVVACITSDKDWRKRIKSASVIISDSLTAAAIQPDERLRIFPLIARESIEALTQL
jgi:GntR family transcriptional regulator